MTDIEERLRRDLAREAERAQPQFLRALRAPQRRTMAWPFRRPAHPPSWSSRAIPRRRWIAPVAAAMTVIALIALAFAGRSVGGGASGAISGSVALPRFYVSSEGSKETGQVDVRDAASGRLVSSVRLSTVAQCGRHCTVIGLGAARDDRMFAVLAKMTPDGPEGTALRVLILHIGADGRSPRLTLSPARFSSAAAAVESFALSPDGTKVALTLAEGTPQSASRVAIEVLWLRTLAVRTWSTPRNNVLAMDGAWTGDGRYLSFLQLTELTGAARSDEARTNQVRVLDTQAPGHSLQASRLVVTGQAVGHVNSAFISPDGATITAATVRQVPAQGTRGTATVKVESLSAATGAVLSVQRVRHITYRNINEAGAAVSNCQVLALAQTGQGALVRCPSTARVANGRWTRLPSLELGEAAW
jgi:hypothetical protein